MLGKKTHWQSMGAETATDTVIIKQQLSPWVLKSVKGRVAETGKKKMPLIVIHSIPPGR